MSATPPASISYDSIAERPALVLSIQLTTLSIVAFVDGLVLASSLAYFLGKGKSDHLRFKAMLGFATFLVGLHAMFCLYGLHIQAVDRFGSPQALGGLPWQTTCLGILGSITAWTVQGFFAYRLYILYSRQIALPVAIMVVASAGVIGVSLTAAGILAASSPNALADLRPKLLVGFVTPAACDIVIAGLMLWKLHVYRQQTAHQETTGLLWQMAVGVFETNVSTTIFCFLLVILYLVGSPVYQSFVFLLAPVYVTTLIIALRVRRGSQTPTDTSTPSGRGTTNSNTNKLNLALSPGNRSNSGIRVETHRIAVVDYSTEGKGDEFGMTSMGDAKATVGAGGAHGTYYESA